MRINPTVSTKNLDDNPQIKKIIEEYENSVFEKSRDTRQQVKLRMVKTEDVGDRFTQYVVVDEEAKHILASYLFVCLIIYFIALII